MTSRCGPMICRKCGHFLLHLQNLVERVLGGRLQGFLFQVGNLQRQFIERGFVIIHDRIEQVVSDAVRRPRNVHCPAHGLFFGHHDALDWHVVIGHEKIFAEKKIQLARREDAFLPAVIHRVDHNEKIRRELVILLRLVIINLRRRAHVHAILDGQRMKMKNFLQNVFGFLRSRIFQIHPQKQIGVGQQGRHQEHINVLAVQFALGCENQGSDHARLSIYRKYFISSGLDTECVPFLHSETFAITRQLVSKCGRGFENASPIIGARNSLCFRKSFALKKDKARPRGRACLGE